jgi:competence protein CoiA
MLSARRKSDGQIVTAYAESKLNGPFYCLQCEEEVILKDGREKANHFAHVNPRACEFSLGESDTHRLCKMEIYEALRQEPGVDDAVLERSLKTVRPDVSAYIRGVPVAIEVQISALSLKTIQHRTEEYARKGIYVLWLLQWTPELDNPRYSPSRWEKWIHTAYFGQVYYWKEGLTVVSYQFEPSLKSVPKKSWYSPAGVKLTGGGYTKRSKRYRAAVRGQTLHLVRDFVHKERGAWTGNGITVPFSRIYIHSK